MDKSESKGSQPDFKGKLDVAAWYNTDRNGKPFLSVVFANRVNLFQIEQDTQAKEVENIFD